MVLLLFCWREREKNRIFRAASRSTSKKSKNRRRKPKKRYQKVLLLFFCFFCFFWCNLCPDSPTPSSYFVFAYFLCDFVELGGTLLLLLVVTGHREEVEEWPELGCHVQQSLSLHKLHAYLINALTAANWQLSYSIGRIIQVPLSARTGRST